MATATQLDGMECSVCTEVFTDPRVLPCGHTYCLKCIEAWSNDKQPGDKLGCPLCRKEFTLSSNGVRDLPMNFCVANFLQMAAVKSSVPTLTHVIPSQGKESVTAVATLGDDVFVARYNSRRVEVYNAETFTLQRHIAVPGFGLWTSGMVACGRNKCLYLPNYCGLSIHRVELSGSNAVKTWPVTRYPAGLSVNNAHNLVVACDGAKRLLKYTTHGSLVREICLQAGVRSPRHAVQLSTGDYAVSQCRSPGVVSVVGVDGQVVHSYGPSQTSDVGEMKRPRSLAVTKNDNILVADKANDRILSINTSTGGVQELALSVEGGIQRPRGLCLDESRGRLYVGEFGEESRVLVFDGVRL